MKKKSTAKIKYYYALHLLSIIQICLETTFNRLL